jgi:hypothetical protein
MGAGLVSALLHALGSARQRVALPGEINHPFLDPYSLAHAGVAALLALFGFSLGSLLLIAVGWEVGEHIFKDLMPWAFPHPTQDTLANSIGDICSALAGWYLCRRLKQRTHPPRAARVGASTRGAPPRRSAADRPRSFRRAARSPR